MVNRGVLDTAMSPTLAGAAKTCFEEMFKLIEAAYQTKYGKSITSENASSEQFKLNFANLVNGMEASVLARCENLILQFANNGTEQIQAFINNVFLGQGFMRHPTSLSP